MLWNICNNESSILTMLGYALVEYISFECSDELLDDIEIDYVICELWNLRYT